MLIFRKKRDDGTYDESPPSIVLVSGNKLDVARALEQLIDEEKVVLVCGSRALVIFMLGVIRSQVPIRIESEDGVVIVEHLLTLEETLTRWTDPKIGLPLQTVEEILHDNFVSPKVKATLRERLSGLEESKDEVAIRMAVERAFRDIYPEGDPFEK